LVDATDEGNEIDPAGDGAGGRRALVAAAGEVAEVTAQDLEVYGPFAGGCGGTPIGTGSEVEIE